jgi:hypothetical protein
MLDKGVKLYIKNYDSRTYSINDFIEWEERKQLQLSPKFQRRSVWSPQAKSFLIDTVIRGKPLPKIFIRQITNPDTRITIREVVDGQQRLRTILNYVKDGFKISKVHNEDYGGLVFSQLPNEIKTDILKYEISVDLLLDLEDRDILDIFARLNTYAVSLNKQELLNAKYFGYFKQLVYKLSFEFSKFWLDNGIFTDTKIMRMAEAELISDMLIAMVEGIHSKKTVEKFYIAYDEEFAERGLMEIRFKSTMDLIGDLLDDTLINTTYRRPHMFYGLFITLYHMNHGVKRLEAEREQIRTEDYAKVRSALANIDQILDLETVPDKYHNFVDSTLKATTDIPSRVARCKFMADYIYNYIKDNN